MGYELVDVLVYAVVSLLNRFFRDCATIDKTLFYDICYASVNIKALETLGYAEHICNYVVILDSWFYGKISEMCYKK